MQSTLFPVDTSLKAYQEYLEEQKSNWLPLLRWLHLDKKLVIEGKDIVCRRLVFHKSINNNIVTIWNKLATEHHLTPADLSSKVIHSIKNRGGIGQCQEKVFEFGVQADTIQKIYAFAVKWLEIQPKIKPVLEKSQDPQQVTNVYKTLFVQDKKNGGKTLLETIYESNPVCIKELKQAITKSGRRSSACRNLFIDKYIELLQNNSARKYLPFFQLAADLIPFLEMDALRDEDQQAVNTILKNFASSLEENQDYRKVYDSTPHEQLFAILLSATKEAHNLKSVELEWRAPGEYILCNLDHHPVSYELYSVSYPDDEKIKSHLAEYHIGWINKIKDGLSHKDPVSTEDIDLFDSAGRYSLSFFDIPNAKSAFFTTVIKIALQQAEKIEAPFSKFSSMVHCLTNANAVPDDLRIAFEQRQKELASS